MNSRTSLHYQAQISGIKLQVSLQKNNHLATASAGEWKRTSH